MSDLLALQNTFQDFLLRESQPIQQMIVSTQKVAATTRLSIYSQAYRVRLVDALASSYPILQAHMGDECFEEMGNLYSSLFPPLIDPYAGLVMASLIF